MSAAAATQLAPSRTPPAGRPAELPLALPLAELGLSLPFLRAAALREHAQGAVKKAGEPGIGLFGPVVGQMFGKGLTTRIATRLSRPACAFVNAYVWRFERGDRLPMHTDRPDLDITISVPLALAGAEAWPLAVRQPNDEVVRWPIKPGTALLLDGRWRAHGRSPFAGDHAYVLLMHWRTPAVRWQGVLAAAECARLVAGHAAGAAFAPSVVDRCIDLARLAVPPSHPPALALHHGNLERLPLAAGEHRNAPEDARVLVPLDGELAVAFDGFDPIALEPGDGLAFPEREACRLQWHTPGRTGTALIGHGSTPITGGKRHSPSS